MTAYADAAQQLAGLMRLLPMNDTGDDTRGHRAAQYLSKAIDVLDGRDKPTLRGRRAKQPWREIAVGESFTVPHTANPRESHDKLVASAKNYQSRLGLVFDVHWLDEHILVTRRV